MESKLRLGPLSCSTRPSDPSSSRLPKSRGMRYRSGSSKRGLKSEDFLFPSRIHGWPHLGTRQYARILESWVEELGLDPPDYGTHSMRRTKATLIYRRTKNLRAVQLLLGHSKLESTVRYLGIEVDDALEIAEQTEIRAPSPGRLVVATPRMTTGPLIRCRLHGLRPAARGQPLVGA